MEAQGNEAAEGGETYLRNAQVKVEDLFWSTEEIRDISEEATPNVKMMVPIRITSGIKEYIKLG